MNDTLFNLLVESKFMPFDIKLLSKNDIIDRKIFDYLFTIDDDIEREKVIMQLEDKAKKEGCLSNFKKLLKEYNKKINLDNKQNIKKSELKHNEVAEQLFQENSIVIHNNTIYIYINGVYTENKKYIERKIIEIIPEADSHFRNEVYKDLELKAEDKKIDKESQIINFQNGLYDLRQKKLLAHSPNFFSINQININFNPNAKNVQAVDNLLNKISTENLKRKQAILEMIGYAMTTSVKLQKGFILYGETARNGKSTLINIITHLIGKNNVGNVSFRDMNKHQFASSGIKGKLLNIGSEMTDHYIDDVSIFKMFISGDDLEIEEKFKPKQTISPYAKFIFNANKLPHVADITNGFYRRLHIIPLETQFTDKDANEFNFNDLITKEALEYLAKISLDAYISMNGNFSNYEESEKEVNKYRFNSNSVLSFMNNKECNPLYDNTKLHTAKSIFDSYKNYCTDNKYVMSGKNTFYDYIEKHQLVLVKIYNNQKHYFLNFEVIKNITP